MKSDKSPVDIITSPQAGRLLRFSNNPLFSMTLVGTLAAAALMAAIVFFGALIPSSLRSQQLAAQLQTQTASKLIDFSIGQIQQRLSFLADQVNTRAALSTQDINTLNAVIAQSFPEASVALAVPVGMSDTPELNDRVGFAPLDMVRRAEKDKNIQPEAGKKGDLWMLYFVAPVNDANGLYLGALLIGVSATNVQKIWAGLDNEAGKFSLLQNKNAVISQGNGDGSSATVKLNVADLSVSFQASGVASNLSYSLIVLLIGVIVAVVVAFLGACLGEIRSQKQLRDDAAHLLKYVHALLVNQTVKAPVVQSTLLKSVTQSIEHYAKQVAKMKTSKPTPNTTTPVSNAAPSQTTADTSIPDPIFQKPEEVLDLDINEDDDLFGSANEASDEETPKLDLDSVSQESSPAPTANVSAEIFRAYDIRGVVNETLTDDVVHLIGLAIGTEAITKGERTILIGYDGRLSSPHLNEVLCKAIAKTGCQVMTLGQVSTPVLYYATATRSTRSGVMITGSHNPPTHNGFKIVIAGKTLSGEDIQALYDRIQTRQFASGDGYISEVTGIIDRYSKHIIKDINLERRLKIVVDCGNGAAGLTAPETFAGLGCDVIPLYCEVDGNFPNHHPDPSQAKNLVDLINKVKSENADIGIAFDGDGDRLGVVTNTGEIIAADRILAILAKSVLVKNKGASIIFDVKCSRILPQVIREAGGVPLMWKTGHSFIKAKLKDSDAVLAGEMSGHIFFKERWFGFDDGLYSAARLLEVLAQRNISSDELFADLPKTITTPEINVSVSDSKKFGIIEALIEQSDFSEGKATTIDGIRVDYADGWGLVRASNTTPCLVLRFEANNQEALKRIQDEFKQKLSAVDGSLALNF